MRTTVRTASMFPLLATLGLGALHGADYFPGDGAALQTALDAAELSPEDDVIHLAAATTYETSATGQPFRFTSASDSGELTIDGEGPTSSLLDGNDLRQILIITTNSGVVLSDLGLVRGRRELTGGSIDVSGAAALIEVFDSECPPLPLNLTLDNVRIADSHAVATDTSLLGGVAYLFVPCGLLTLTDVTFSQNSGVQAGTSGVLGGILRVGDASNIEASTVATNLSFTGNSVSSSGEGTLYGGLADFNAGAVTIAGMEIDAQTVISQDLDGSDSYGAMVSIFTGDGDVLLSDVSMIGARAELSGNATGSDQVLGGLIAVTTKDAATIRLERFWLEGNTFVNTANATIYGGILHVGAGGLAVPSGATLTLSASRILNNQVTSVNQSLGLISFQGGSRITNVINNAIGNNRLTVTGPNDVLGGALLGGGDPLTLVHNTFWNNVLSSPVGNTRGGGLFVGNGADRIDLYNNIFWGNTAVEGADVRLFGTAFEVNLSHNDIGVLSMEGETVGIDTGNVSVNPLFASGGADFHLGFGSPVIDAGNPAAPLMPTLDLDGDPRVIPPAPDMGADEAVDGGIVPGPPPEPIPALSWPAIFALAGALALAGTRLAR